MATDNFLGQYFKDGALEVSGNDASTITSVTGDDITNAIAAAIAANPIQPTQGNQTNDTNGGQLNQDNQPLPVPMPNALTLTGSVVLPANTPLNSYVTVAVTDMTTGEVITAVGHVVMQHDLDKGSRAIKVVGNCSQSDVTTLTVDIALTPPASGDTVPALTQATIDAFNIDVPDTQ